MKNQIKFFVLLIFFCINLTACQKSSPFSIQNGMDDGIEIHVAYKNGMESKFKIDEGRTVGFDESSFSDFAEIEISHHGKLMYKIYAKDVHALVVENKHKKYMFIIREDKIHIEN